MIYNSFVFNATRQAISVCWSLIRGSRLQQIAHSEIYQTCKYDNSEKIVYDTEPEIGNNKHKTTGENC